MSGICMWNIIESFQKKRKNAKIIKTPYSQIQTPSFSSNWSKLTPLTPLTPLQKQSSVPVPLSQSVATTPLHLKFQKSKHTTDNSILQYPKDISDKQVSVFKVWIVNKILRPFVKDLKRVDSVYSLNKSIDHGNKTIPFIPIDDPLIECEEPYELRPDNKWVLRRLTYELFLQIPSTDQSLKARKYLINRIQELAQHSQLINYCSDSKTILQFEPTYATDGQIILHFVDCFLKINAPYHSQSILQFVCCMNRLPDEYGFTYKRTLYKLDDKESLMKSLVAFVLYVQDECAGYFGLLNLATPMVKMPNLVVKMEEEKEN